MNWLNIYLNKSYTKSQTKIKAEPITAVIFYLLTSETREKLSDRFQKNVQKQKRTSAELCLLFKHQKKRISTNSIF